MKRIFFWINLLIISAFITACGSITIDVGGGETSGQNLLQAVIDSPPSGSTLNMGAVDISYHANAKDGVAAVELSVDGQVLSNVVTPDSKQQLVSMKYTWQPSVSGGHVIRVRVQSSKGQWSPYAEATITIQGQSQQQQQQQQQPPPPTDTPEPTPTPEGYQFSDFQKSATKFYFGANSCGPVKLTLHIKADPHDNLFQVLVSNRLWDRESADSSGWYAYAMKPLGGGEYTYTFTETTVANPKGFEFSNFWFQFTAVDKQGGRENSQVYKEVQFDKCT